MRRQTALKVRTRSLLAQQGLRIPHALDSKVGEQKAWAIAREADGVWGDALRRTAEERVDWTAPAHMTLRDLEKRMIESTLQRTRGNIKAAAESLGIDRSTLYDKIRRYDIER